MVRLRLMNLSVLRHDQAGGGPAAGPAGGPFFLLRQKEVTKKKATARLLPCGFPKAGASQGEGRKLASLAGRRFAYKRIPLRRRIACDPKPLLHLRQCGLLIPCLTPTFGSYLNAGYFKSHFNFNFNTVLLKVVGCNALRLCTECTTCD